MWKNDDNVSVQILTSYNPTKYSFISDIYEWSINISVRENMCHY